MGEYRPYGVPKSRLSLAWDVALGAALAMGLVVAVYQGLLLYYGRF